MLPMEETISSSHRHRRMVPAQPAPLVSQLRQLLSFDSPRVFMGQRWPIIKQEKGDEDLPSKKSHLVQEEEDDHPPLTTTPLTSSCSLCTHAPGVKHLSILSFSDSGRDDHLRSLLGSRENDDGDFIFCILCRHVVTRLFQLKEEAQDIEDRIRGVVKLRKVSSEAKGIEDESKNTDDDHHLADKSEPRVFSGSAKGSNDQRTSGVHPVGPRERHALKTPYKKGKTLYNGILPPIIPSFNRGGRTLFRCPQCWKHFTRKDRVLSHMSSFHGLTLNSIIKNRGGTGRRRKVCPVCKRGFHDMELLKAHSHPDPKDPWKVLYTCSVCGKTFRSSAHLRQHRDIVHLKKYRVTCPICKKVFQRKQGLQKHSKRRICSMPQEPKDGNKDCSPGEGGEGRDKGSASTKCYLCSEVLEDVGSLANHLRIHSLQAPFGV